MYVDSCSSSTTISPKFPHGANTADRAPMTTRASPRRMRRHSSKRSPALSRECSTAATAPNRARNHMTICGVRAISGTRIMADFPCTSVWRTRRMNTSVLPLPVTPWSRYFPCPLRKSGSMTDSASSCPGVRGGSGTAVSGVLPPGRRSTSSSRRAISPAASIWRSACSGSRTSSFNSSTGCVRPSDKTVSSRRRFGERFSASVAASSISRGFAACATVCVFT